ncbi:MAG: 4Fe-4S dicluster domain-containing protein [Geovibrio sp.]|jgi:ferredoxin-type protein NapG|nr:4Fe-4S dicluster domain-containing protein [Geovibrio sp.]
MIFTRRNFIKTAVISLLSPAEVFAGNESVSPLRPPGALPENEFLSKCIRCQKCLQVCPTKVLVPTSLSHGIIAVNTPAVSFRRGYCNSCLKCAEVCPTGALVPVTKETLDIGTAAIIEKDCVAWDWTGCTVCVDNCPLKAIYLDEHKRPVVIPEKCNGCGICELKCPSPSLRASIQGKGIIVIKRPSGVPPRNAGSDEAGKGQES